jgi:hypothetical protein
MPTRNTLVAVMIIVDSTKLQQNEVKKVKLSLWQAVEALRFVRRRGFHIF